MWLSRLIPRSHWWGKGETIGVEQVFKSSPLHSLQCGDHTQRSPDQKAVQEFVSTADN